MLANIKCFMQALQVKNKENFVQLMDYILYIKDFGKIW